MRVKKSQTNPDPQPISPSLKKGTTFRVPPALIKEEKGFNLRDYRDPDVIAQIEVFAQAYQEGQFVPSLITRTNDDGDVVVIEGHLRRRGALLAIERGAPIPFLECEKFCGSDVERIELMLRSTQGLKFKALEIAKGFQKLRRLGYDTQQIAASLNCSRTRVEQMLLLANANQDVQNMVRYKKISAQCAIDALAKHGELAGKYLGDLLESNGAITRQVMRGQGIPPQLANNVKEGFSSLFDDSLKNRLEQWTEGGKKKGVRIPVDATVLYELQLIKCAIDARQKINKRRLASARVQSNGTRN